MSDLQRVTEILRVTGWIDVSAPWYSEHARARGTAVHRACALLAAGDLDEDTIDPQIVGRLEAFRSFWWEQRPEILASEEEIRNEVHGYAGRPDFRMRFAGSEWVIDLKPPSAAAWHPIQLAAYAHCYDRPMRRANLYLSDSARYRFVERVNLVDWRKFLQALELYRRMT